MIKLSLIGAALIVATIWIHAAGTLYWMRFLVGRCTGKDGSWRESRTLLILLGSAIFLVTVHVLEILIWAVAYRQLVPDELPTLEQAALAGLFMGRRIFAGAGLGADAATWSYGYLTMIVILAPAVADSAMGTAAGAGFVSRLLMFVCATIYAVAAVYITNALSPWRGQDKAAPAARAGLEQV
jgi:hypothetical protein